MPSVAKARARTNERRSHDLQFADLLDVWLRAEVNRARALRAHKGAASPADRQFRAACVDRESARVAKARSAFEQAVRLEAEARA